MSYRKKEIDIDRHLTYTNPMNWIVPGVLYKGLPSFTVNKGTELELFG